MRITNVNTMSALLDRLITENIKLFFFEKDGLTDKVNHQRVIIGTLRIEIDNLFEEMLDADYEYLEEKRTFIRAFPMEVESLVLNDIRIGEADRARLQESIADTPDFYRMMFNEIRLRVANENRATNKNSLDYIVKKIVEE